MGASAVLHEPLTFNQLSDIDTANAVISAFKSRKESKSWAGWAEENKEAAGLLAASEIEATKRNYI